MNSIEPLEFDIEGRGLDLDENYDRRLPEHTNWSATQDFLLNQVVSDFSDEISPTVLKKKYREIIRSEIEPLEDVLPPSPHDDDIQFLI